MENYCKAKCEECGLKKGCKGCLETCGNPFGGNCIAAEYIKTGGMENYILFQKQLIEELNQLHIEGMPEITELNCLVGGYVNLEYSMPGGQKVKLLKDNRIYLGTQVQCEFDDFSGKEKCFGIVADSGFLLVCEYGENGADPEIVVYKRR